MRITKKSYFGEIKRIGFENLPEPLKKIHLVLMTKTDLGNDWSRYDKDKEFKKTIDLAFERLTDFIKNNRKDLSGIAERNSLLDGTFKPSQELDGMDSLSLELKFISRFMKLAGRIISKKELKNYIDDLQEAIRKKKIRKDCTNAEEIIYIQKSLISIYNTMGRHISIRLRQPTIERMTNIIAKAEKKPAKKKTAKRKKQKSVTLRGIPETKEKKEEIKPQNHLMSSVDFAEMKFESLGFSQKWKDLMGDPSKGFTAMVYGKPKTGKSYLSVDFAGYLARHHGNTLYVAREEKLDATLHKKLQDKEVVHQNLFVSDFLPDDLSKYEFIFIDSVNKLGLSPQDIENLRTKNPGKSFIFIFQTTKQGQFRGRNEFQHDVDIVIEVPERGKAVQFGRFNQGGEMDIFDETQENGKEADNVPEALMGTEPERNLAGKKKDRYKYIIDLNERGSFKAHVENSEGKVVYEFAAGNELSEGESSIFEDGFMKNENDVDGLEKYLKQLKILKTEDRITEEDLSGGNKNKEIIKIEAEFAIPLEELAIEYFGNKPESHPEIVNTLDNHSTKITPLIERILKKEIVKNHATLEKIQFSEMDSANLSHGAAYFKVILKGSPVSLRKIAGEDKLIFYEWER